MLKRMKMKHFKPISHLILIQTLIFCSIQKLMRMFVKGLLIIRNFLEVQNKKQKKCLLYFKIQICISFWIEKNLQHFIIRVLKSKPKFQIPKIEIFTKMKNKKKNKEKIHWWKRKKYTINKKLSTLIIF